MSKPIRNPLAKLVYWGISLIAAIAAIFNLVTHDLLTGLVWFMVLALGGIFLRLLLRMELTHYSQKTSSSLTFCRANIQIQRELLYMQ